MLNKIIKFLKKYLKLVLPYIIAVFATYAVLILIMQPSNTEKIKSITYAEFVEYLNKGDIDVVYINTSMPKMQIALYNDETRNMSLEDRLAYTYESKDLRQVDYPSYPEFKKDLLEKNVRLATLTQPTNILSSLISIVMLAIPLALFIMIFQMMGASMKGLNKKQIIQTSDVSFDDIIGLDEIIDDLKFIVDLIKNPEKGDKLGVKLPKGILLEGPPGTGKTLIAKAIAHEAGVPFLYISASSFIEMFVGLGAKRVRELFKIAKSVGHCVLFIDEIDAIGGNRSNNNISKSSEDTQTINQLLTNMDGFDERSGLFIIAATNRADDLDPALLRSGRFDRRIVVNPPRDYIVRQQMFEHYLKDMKVADDVNIEGISKQTPGFTGADIKMVCNEAGIRAMQHQLEAVNNDCIEEAIDIKIFKGNHSKKKAHERDREIIAYHEAGHAVMNYLLGLPIARASIQSTISGVGGVVFREELDTQFMTKNDYENTILVCYAGRASEQIKYSDITTGASNDITQATNMMMQYIEHLGFDNNFGLLDMSVLGQNHILNSDSVTEKLSKMSNDLYEKTLELLKANYDKVEILAQALLEAEQLSGEEIGELLKSDEKVPEAPRTQEATRTTSD